MRALRGADDDRQVPAARLHAPHAGKHEALYLVSIFDQEFYIQDPVSLLLDIKQVQLQRVEFHNVERCYTTSFWFAAPFLSFVDIGGTPRWCRREYTVQDIGMAPSFG